MRVATENPLPLSPALGDSADKIVLFAFLSRNYFVCLHTAVDFAVMWVLQCKCSSYFFLSQVIIFLLFQLH